MSHSQSLQDPTVSRYSPILQLFQPDLPILVSIQESREDAVQVCARADEQQDDEQERLEFEDAELFPIRGWWLACDRACDACG